MRATFFLEIPDLSLVCIGCMLDTMGVGIGSRVGEDDEGAVVGKMEVLDWGMEGLAVAIGGEGRVSSVRDTIFEVGMEVVVSVGGRVGGEIWELCGIGPSIEEEEIVGMGPRIDG